MKLDFCLRVILLALSSQGILLTSTLHAESSSSSPEHHNRHTIQHPTPSPTPIPRCTPLDCRNRRVASELDLNGDCRFDAADISELSRNLEQRPVVSGLRFDINHDGQVNNLDLTAMQSSFSLLGCSPPPTATPTPTPVPTQNPECAYVVGWSMWSTNFGDPYSLVNMMQRFNYTRADELPSCMLQFMGSQRAAWSSMSPGNFDWLVQSLAGRLRIEGGIQPSDIKRFYLLGLSIAHLSGFIGVPAGRGADQIWYMDKNCRWIPNVGNRALCGFAGASVSPISLMLWDALQNPEDPATVVEFNLSLNPERRYSLWRASGRAPLLVHDPQNTGMITSPTQLFGNFTFGGRLDRKSSDDVSTRKEQLERLPWSNGFEPLGLFDTSGDGVIAGDELKEISLWFDTNRNGISEHGEVRSAKDEGILKLYYRGAEQIQGSKDVQLDIGFERNTKAGITRGRAVDWFGETFISKVDAITALSAISRPLQGTLQANPSAAREEDPLLFRPKESSDDRADVSGSWTWAILDKDGEKHPGLFVFSQSKDGTVSGYSVTEANVVDSKGTAQRIMATLPLKGITFINDKNEREVSFSIADKKTGAIAYSNAYLSPDGRMIAGNTNQLFVSPFGEKRSAMVSYSWIAGKSETN